MTPSRLVTIKDVAKEAGVSIGAVSKVLHGRGGNIRVGEATATRIRDAARLLSYRPNYHARSLRSGRSRSVGVVAASPLHGFAAGMRQPYMTDRLMTILHRKGYTLDFAPELMPLADIQGLSDGRFDGLVWMDAMPVGPLVEAFYASPVPVVGIGGEYNAVPERGALFLTEEEASYGLLLDHLAGFSHRNLMYADRPAEIHDALGERRRAEFVRIAQQRGFTVVARSAENEAEALDQWREMSPRPTAIIAYCDRHGAMLMIEAMKRGLKIPEHVSLIAFDGSPLTLWAWPGLTTIRPPVDTLIDRATDHLISQMERLPSDPVLERYLCTLDVQGSVGPPAA